MRLRPVAPGLAMAAALLSATCAGDDTQPLFVSLAEPEALVFEWRARLPPQVPRYNAPRPLLPLGCTIVGNPNAALSRDPVRVRCKSDISGSSIRLAYPVAVPPTPLIVRVTYADGQTHTVLAGAGKDAWEMPRRETASSVTVEYTQLGIHHIWAGADHLLFLVCLMWVSGTWRRMLVTVTGFTLAHSLTLVLSALQIVRLPLPPIESAIALSVVFLAREVALGNSTTLTWRQPVAVASSFGLLHGLGFAAVLGEIGLPQKELITGLVCFNVGVEIGQLCFIAAVATVLYGINRVIAMGGGRELYRLALGYAVGGLATFWLIDRTDWLF